MEEKKKKKKGKGKKIFKAVILTLLSIFILVGVAGTGVALAIVKTAPPLDVNAILTLNEPSALYDNKGVYITDVATDEKRDVVALKYVTKDLANAFVSIEDERFYTHKGVDIKRVIGVIYIDVLNKLTGKNELQGASTITQQLVRNIMLTDITKEANIIESSKRKIREMYLATQLEKRLSKNQILEAYMNTIPFGGIVNGVEAASKYYFNKPASKLSLIQSAYLAGVPQAPGIYNAFLEARKKDPSKYLNRTKMVLTAMHKNGYITKEKYDKAVKDLSVKNLQFNHTSTSNSNRLDYEWFALPAIEQVKKDLNAQYNYTDEEINSLIMYGGLKIYTTMDRSLQDSTQDILNNSKNYGSIKTKTLNGIMDPQASAVIMDYHTGEVKVIIGGRGTQPARSFNRAAYNGSKEFLKAVGSTIKPLTVYSAAIDSKKSSAATVVEDSPIGSDIRRQWPGWEPKNDNLRFSGYVTLREAIKNSINLVAVKEEFNIGLQTGISYGEKYGLTFNSTKDKTSLAALSLGELNDGENTLSMAAAYGVFGNSGMYITPRLYTKVVDRRGVTILENQAKTRKVISPQSAYIMYDLLKGPTSSGGTGPSAKFGSMPAAGKTGTTGDKKELWFSGLTPYYAGSVWVGHDKPARFPRGISSNTVASIWGKIMKEAHKNLPVKDISRPSGIVARTVCKESGKIPTDLCYKDSQPGSQVYTELFIAGTQPTTLCDVHVEAQINKSNGKLATEFTPKELLETRVFIKRDYKPSKSLGDQAYVLPTEYDDTKPAPEVPQPTPEVPQQPPNIPGETPGDSQADSENGKDTKSESGPDTTPDSNTNNTPTTP